ncbi:MAG: HlyD family efflux transporter periplasmic adaptor subunit [Bacteroidales bacterium]
MDKELPLQVLKNKKRKFYIRAGIGAFILIVLLVLMNRVLSGSINASDFVTDKVKMGEITSTITASGTILPEFEELFLSPIASRIIEVVAGAGSQINEGDTLLILDRESINLAVQKMNDELELNKAQLEKQKLGLDKSIKELETDISIRELKIKSLEAVLQNQKRLFDIGGGTQEELEKADLNLKIATLELKQRQQNLENLKESAIVEIKEKQLQIEIQMKNLEEIRKKAEGSIVISHRKGVLTWIVDQIGSEVRDKQELAKISDLNSFKLKGNISDMYASRIQTGQDVLIKVNDSLFNGKVTTIMPAVNNSIIEFMVALKEKDNKMLRSNMKVDVYLVTNYKSNAKIVRNSGFYTGKTEQYVFVKKGNRAERRLVKTGISNFELVEIMSGIEVGEEMITTDMKAYENRKHLKIK